MKNESNLNVNEEINIFDILLAIAKRKWFIIVFTTIFSILAVIYSLITPEIWRSSTKFITISDSMSSSSLGSSLLGNMGLDFMGGITSSEAMSNLMILDSRDLQKKTIRHFDLVSYYEIAEEDTLIAMEKALRIYNRETYSVFYDKETTAIIVSVKTKDKYFSQEITQYILDELIKFNQNDRTSKGKLKRQFLEGRVNELDQEFTALTEQIVSQKKESKMISVENQTKQVMELYAELVSDLTKTSIEISIIKKLYGDQNPKLLEKEQRVSELKEVIEDLEQNSALSKYIVPIDDIPEIASKDMVLEMQIEINRKIFEFIYPQYELARMEELKDLPTIDIISKPDVEGLRLKPKRALICIIAFMVSLMFSSVFSLVLEFTSDENKIKFNKAMKLIIGKK